MKSIALFLCILSQLTLSQETAPESEFQLETGLMDRLYDESVTESENAAVQYRTGVSISPIFSYFNPSQMTLQNDYFEVPYSENLGGVPGISLIATGKLFSFGGIYLLGLGGVGYSMKEGVQKAYSKTASADPERTARLTLHWLPISIGSRLEYRFSGFEAVRPFVQIKSGADWFYQVGQLDGIEQGFWVPYYAYGAGLTLFDSPSTTDRWFGGLTFSLSQRQSFSSQQVVQGWVFDLGVAILL